jgi:hypothetical protein
MILNFEINSSEPCSQLFLEKGIKDFHSACSYVHNLPYGRISNPCDLLFVLQEEKGTCSSKHALLGRLAEENNQLEIEVVMGLFLMSPETHPVLTDFFSDKMYAVIPEAHCYLRYKGIRYDFTSTSNSMSRIENKIIREQRIEPHQTGEWKVKIHQEYLGKWLKRHSELSINLEEIWKDREKCILLL